MFRTLGIGLIAGWIIHDIYNSDKDRIVDAVKKIAEKVVDYGKNENNTKQAV